MSLPVGKAIYLIAFSLLLSYIRKLTDQPATRIAYCLLMLLMLISYVDICFFKVFIYTFVLSLKTMSNLIFYFMEKYYLCSVQSKTNPNQNETVLVPVEDIFAFVSSCITPDCVILVSNCSTFKAISDEK